MPFADLVLEGGGVKGIALVGAISVLEERGYTFRRVAGTSAGAIVASLVAAGFDAASLETVMREVDYRKFKDGDAIDKLLVGKMLAVAFEQGIFHGDYLCSWLGDLLSDEGVRTFADLHYQDQERPLPPEQQYRLVVMASDLSQGCLRRLPWHYDHYGRDRDTQSVVEAVRASMSIPLFYKPVKWQTSDAHDSWLIDGGALSNFPIDVFDAVAPRWPTIGIKLSAQPDAAQGIVNDIHGTATLLLALGKTLTSFYDRMHIDDPSVADRTIFVDTGKVQATDFGISSGQRDQLFNSGRRAAIDFLDGRPAEPGRPARPKWDFETWKVKYRSGNAAMSSLASGAG